MGGPGSGSFPDNPNHRGGRSKKAAVQVCGTGVPIKPDDMLHEVSEIWNRVYDLVAGVAFEQDSDAVAELAWLLWRQGKLREALYVRPLDIDLNKQSLAIGRSLNTLLFQFGLTPRSRQVLLVPKEEAKEVDPFDALKAEYG
tara:strand:- start:73 stop:498 length:426 start_codon:yes stop_codon:yes gene_type:complete